MVYDVFIHRCRVELSVSEAASLIKCFHVVFFAKVYVIFIHRFRVHAHWTLEWSVFLSDWYSLSSTWRYVSSPGLRSVFFFSHSFSTSVGGNCSSSCEIFSFLQQFMSSCFPRIPLFCVFFTIGAPSGTPRRFSQLFDFSDTDMPCLALPCGAPPVISHLF